MAQKNQNWTRDEAILALALYFDPLLGTISSKNSKVIALSKLLNRFPSFGKERNLTFRNPNGIAMQLGNFKAIDPNYKGRGMKSYSRLFKEVFEEFSNDLPRLNHIADEIKKVVANPELVNQLSRVGEDEVTDADGVSEGQILYRLHRVKERSRKIVEQKKTAVFKETGKLECEACGFNFVKKYGQLGYWFIECHHLIPLATLQEAKITKLADLSLLCSNCHRMIHRDLSCVTIGAFQKLYL